MDRTATISANGEGLAAGVLRRLVVAHGAVLGGPHVRVLEGEALVVGREAGEATLVLDDARVSRRHARLAPGEGGWVVTDLGSRNGVWVDGERRERAALRDGSVIRVGKSLLLFTEQVLDGLSLTRPEEGPLFGPSAAMGRVRGEIERAARSPLPVLVLGETGVGKELAAAAIHAQSGRRGPLVPVNCAAVAPTVAEGELFGHEAGAFTGASGRREGLFAAAEGGTLFLDEIGELPLEVQPKLLRALALGEVRPVGATRARRVDVRVVAATLRDLDAAERSGAFRADLHARLAGFTVRLPPLRERREDVLALAARFLGARPGGAELSADAAEALLLHDFPHNVRELEHVLGAALARWDGAGPLGPGLLPAAIGGRVLARERPAEPEPSAAARASEAPGGRPSRDELVATLVRFEGNVARVAAHYGKDRHQVYRWMERLGIDLAGLRGRGA